MPRTAGGPLHELFFKEFERIKICVGDHVGIVLEETIVLS